jgi:hypothetical protein
VAETGAAEEQNHLVHNVVKMTFGVERAIEWIDGLAG